jgi:hypothetical protein
VPMDEAELRRTVLDVLKHITTLSTGTIVIASTFAEKVPRSDKGTMVWAFVCLFSSLTTAISGLMWLEHADRRSHRFLCKFAGATLCAGILFLASASFPLIRFF